MRQLKYKIYYSKVLLVVFCNFSKSEKIFEFAFEYMISDNANIAKYIIDFCHERDDNSFHSNHRSE